MHCDVVQRDLGIEVQVQVALLGERQHLTERLFRQWLGPQDRPVARQRLHHRALHADHRVIQAQRGSVATGRSVRPARGQHDANTGSLRSSHCLPHARIGQSAILGHGAVVIKGQQAKRHDFTLTFLNRRVANFSAKLATLSCNDKHPIEPGIIHLQLHIGVGQHRLC